MCLFRTHVLRGRGHSCVPSSSLVCVSHEWFSVHEFQISSFQPTCALWSCKNAENVRAIEMSHQAFQSLLVFIGCQGSPWENNKPNDVCESDCVYIQNGEGVRSMECRIGLSARLNMIRLHLISCEIMICDQISATKQLGSCISFQILVFYAIVVTSQTIRWLNSGNAIATQNRGKTQTSKRSVDQKITWSQVQASFVFKKGVLYLGKWLPIKKGAEKNPLPSKLLRDCLKSSVGEKYPMDFPGLVQAIAKKDKRKKAHL